MNHTARALTVAALLGALLTPALAQNGPGLPNQSYPPGDHLRMLTRLNVLNDVPNGQGFVTMHRGYLLVIFSGDSGGGAGTGGFALLDISNPTQPRTAFTTNRNPAYNRGSPNDAMDIREAHGFTFSGDILCTPSNGAPGATGLQFWDFSSPLQPQKIGFTTLPGLTGGDYSPSPWWVCWQGGRTVYVAGTSGGLYIVDATDPRNPRLATRPGGAPNPIPVQQLGIPRCNVVYAVGNLLMVSNASGSGFSLLDIGDPHNPQLISSSTADVGYSTMLNGDKVYAAGDPAKVYDVSNPSAISLIAAGPDLADKGGYGIVQDGVFHYGSSDKYVKLDTRSVPFQSLGTTTPPGFFFADWDFATPLGNLAHVGNDHPLGSAIIIHDVAPDTTGPSVNMVSPRDGATGQPTTSRIGLTFSDQVDGASIAPTTLIVRQRGGIQITGRVSSQTGIVNFWPDAPLLPNVTYDVEVPAGGIRDFAGNPVPTTFRSSFTTGAAGSGTILTSIQAGAPSTTGASATFQAGAVTGASGPFEYRWSFGDGTQTPWGPNPTAFHTYAAPGHYTVVLEVRTPGGQHWTSSVVRHTVHRPLTAGLPTVSSTLARDRVRGWVWSVNPDNATVSAIDGATHQKLLEVPVGARPRSLAFAPRDGLVWVICQEDATVRVLHPASGVELARTDLPQGSAPFGLAFTPAGDAAFVTLQATGELAEIDPVTRALRRTLAVGPTPRGVSVTHDGQTVLVSRHVSPETQGEVTLVDVQTGSVTTVAALAHDPGPDTEDGGRGVPNYLGAPAISPDGVRAWIPSKKDNVRRGAWRDGQPLTFENSVRAIASQLDLTQGIEDLSARIDFNDRDSPSAVAFSPLGDYAFVALQGNNAVEVRDAYDGSLVLAMADVGRAPQGLTLAGDHLYVHGFLSRTVTVYDVSQLLNGTAVLAPRVAQVSTVASERLAADVLRGKQIFYDASDPRMSLDSYLSCASCHLEGGSDGRVWDFTDRGEGLRNTADLRGRAGTGQGPLHWTANFDEVQDFEHDIRGAFGGRGFLTDAEFNAASDPLGTPKAGVSADLDALAAYVTSLDRVPDSPHRDPSGGLTPFGLAGRAVFRQQQCHTCHGGPAFSDSLHGARHDVGTILPSSGGRLGAPLDAIDTPTLRGLHATAPYLHDGSATTLDEVFNRSGPAHGNLRGLSPVDRLRLISYLQQIDDREPDAALGPATVRIAEPTGTLTSGAVMVRYVAGGDLSGVSTAALSLDGGAPVVDPTFDGSHWLTAAPGAHVLEVQLLDGAGNAVLGARARATFFVGTGLHLIDARAVPAGSHPNDPAAWRTLLMTRDLAVGAPLNDDRAHTFTSVGNLGGAPYFPLLNADKDVAGARYMRFRVSRPVTVTIAYDARAAWLPAWLHGWRPAGQLSTTDGARNLYAKDFPAGLVTLGGSQAPGVNSIYTPIVTPR